MAFLSNWRLIAFGIALLVGVVGSGAAYSLWERNVALREDLRNAKAQVGALEDARVRDALAAHKLIEAAHAEQARLTSQLRALSEIQDEEGRTYLDSIVPDSVRRVLNP